MSRWIPIEFIDNFVGFATKEITEDSLKIVSASRLIPSNSARALASELL